jgi:transcriptional regulator with XRE-family HTH domain
MSPLEPKHPAIARTVRSLRLKTGMTQEALALEVGISAGEICRLEKGRRNPKWETMERLAEGVGVPCWEMVKVAEEIKRELEEDEST